ncbi:ATP-binding protein [Streptomyces sp. ISL-112]|uniref:ATP-binding protein n=1 Tax=unclassified Streptomyces TaxID=2593676 RepID=UPI001BE52B8D|nr:MULTISPECIES: ATP-binding protein [unclassified Streptomyces]MBT2425835.1 ATP-binding protein [Streptomyces sp. ISL-112]MBT2460818.1 ATP-binding protein [Streptomyces sp. ISL-63]
MTERAEQAGYFCISGRPTYGGSLGNLEKVPEEVRALRAGLGALGLTELFPGAKGDGDALSHSDLRNSLDAWSRDAAGYTGARTATLVIYATGHGLQLGKDWGLIPTEYEVPVVPEEIDRQAVTYPAALVQPLQRRRELAQVLLILDACGAAPGGEQALLDSISEGSYRAVDDQLDLWVVAAARRSEKALETFFSEAFTTALDTVAAPSTARPYLDLTQVMEAVQGALTSTEQKARIVAGHGDPRCRALPNPRYMPPEPPTWLPPGWGRASRGVVNDVSPGWYFTGREAALRTLLDHLTGAGTAPPLWLTGSHGCGKTAVLGRVVSTATAELRAALPVVARHGVLPVGDLALTAVDARGRTADRLATDIARSLGLTAVDAPGLLAELRWRSPEGVRGLVVDHLDEAEEPAAVLAGLVEQLAALPDFRVVVAAARPLPGRPARLILDLDDPVHQGASAVEAYLRTRLTYGGQLSDGAVAALRQICGGCFAAAVTAADVLDREGTSLEHACEAVAGRLDALLRRTCEELLPRTAEAVADTLTALCSFGDDIFVDVRTWAAVASRLAGAPAPASLSPQELAACLPALRTLLVRRDAPGTQPEPGDAGESHGAWRPRHPLLSGGQAPRRTVLHHLRDELRVADRAWENVPGHLLAVLAAAVADQTTGMQELLDDPDFLLALPRTTMTRTVRGLRGADQAARTAVWNALPRRGTRQQRRFVLALAAARRGLADLARAVGPVVAPCGSLEVVWANPGVRSRHAITRVSAAGEPGPGSLVTAHDDGTLIWWDGGTGEQVASRPGLGPVRDLYAISDTTDTGGGEATGDTAGACALVVLADGSVLRTAPDADAAAQVLRTGSGELPGPSASHSAGLLALTDGQAVEVLSVSSSGAESVGVEVFRRPVAALAVAGRWEEPVVWAATLDGVVHQWFPRGSATPRRVALCPNPVHLVASADGGTAVIMDAAGTCAVLGGALPLPGTVPLVGHAVRALHLTADWFVVVGGDRDGSWLDTHNATDGTGVRWPLDGLPAGICSHGPDGLVVATSGALALLRARTGHDPEQVDLGNWTRRWPG